MRMAEALASLLLVATVWVQTVSAAPSGVDQPLQLTEVVAMVVNANPQVRGARARWDSARQQIIQNYTPADPQFAFSNQDSWRGFLYGSGLHNLSITQALQFPGKGLLQGKEAWRRAEIARLTYRAMLRDLIAQAKTAYYQLQLDLALDDLIEEDVVNLDQVLRTTGIAYTANLATQGDMINAKFALEAQQETARQQIVTIANDKTALNVLLDRRPDEPLQVERKFDLEGMETTLDQIVERAVNERQEILEAALTEQNADTAVTLAQLEYAPDYTVGFGFDHWLIGSFAPSPNHPEDWNFLVGFNLPLFFWAKNADIASARKDLEAAHEDLDSIRTQTAGEVTTMYRQILRSRQTALLYSDTLVPLARQAFAVELVAYQGGKADFTTLIATFRQLTDSRSAYLQAVNQLLAQKVALEQAAGGGLQ